MGVEFEYNGTLRQHHQARVRELRITLVQVMLGMVRNKRITSGYRIVGRYAAMKKEKGSGRAIIATVREIAQEMRAPLTAA